MLENFGEVGQVGIMVPCVAFLVAITSMVIDRSKRLIIIHPTERGTRK